MAVVTQTVHRPDGTISDSVQVAIVLLAAVPPRVGEGFAPGRSLAGVIRPEVAPDGSWSADLTPNDQITPAGTVYQAIENVDGLPPVELTFIVTDAGGDIGDLLVDPPGTLPSSALAQEVARAIAAEARLIPLAQKGAAGGVATLDPVTGFLTVGQLPPIQAVKPYAVASQAAMLALPKNPTPLAIRTDLQPAQTFVYNGGNTGTLADWTEIQASDAIQVVNGQVGPAVVLAAADVGADPVGSALAEQNRAVAAEAGKAQGLVRTPVKVAPLTYAAQPGEYVPWNLSGAAQNGIMNLPAAPPDRTRVGWKIVAQSTLQNTLTVNASGADVFNAPGTNQSLVFRTLKQAALAQYDAATHSWDIQATDGGLPDLYVAGSGKAQRMEVWGHSYPGVYVPSLFAGQPLASSVSYAAGGTSVTDYLDALWWADLQRLPAESVAHLENVMYGINDIAKFGPVGAEFSSAMRTLLSRIRCAPGAAKPYNDPALTYAAGWLAAPNGVVPIGGCEYSATNGSTFTWKSPAGFPGGTVAIHTYVDATGFGATHTWTLNGNAVGALNTVGMQKGPRTQRFVNIPADAAGGNQVIQCTISGFVGFTCIIGWHLERAAPPLITLMKQPLPPSYAIYGAPTAPWTHVPTDADVGNLNAALVAVAAEFDTFVTLVDIQALLNRNPALFLADGLHPGTAPAIDMCVAAIWQAIRSHPAVSAVPNLTVVSLT